jgi:stage V sporulation protein G
MRITEVKVTSVDQKQLRAYVTIILDGCFAVRDLKIIRGPKGYFVAMPSKKRRDGTFRDIAHPINKSTRIEMEEFILKAYKERIDQFEDDKRNKGDNLNISDNQEFY